MGEIYRHSTCNIAATGARNSSEGLLLERSSLAFTPYPLLEWQDGTGFQAERISKWPEYLRERACAVQERFLSPRVLAFGTDRVSWACRYARFHVGPHARHVKL